ncbi:MAG: altronate hydrolase [Promethearchaeota archaeon]|nr:MAG: altronate hydrolase [Candidatus Lokiarchaeota archaeon]
MDKADNCATAIDDIDKGEEIDYSSEKLKIKQPIALGHKFALIDIKVGNYIKKYGQIIGVATENINKGEWIHTHNIISHYLKEVLNQ